GYSPEELLDKNFSELIYEEDLEKTIRIFHLTIQDGGSQQKNQFRLKRKTGEFINLDTTTIPIIVDGQIVGMYGIAKDITEQIRNEEMVQHLAYHDYLTGLPNRNMLNALLTNGAITIENLAVLFIDLDRFKIVNDT
ncbi:PAS domain S-box protein, partial [Paenibacillus polysaccharolyticus]